MDRHLRAATAAAGALLFAAPALADETAEEAWTLHGQATFIRQAKPALRADYSGANSLLTRHELSYSFTGTAAAGARLWRGGEAYFNAELVQGVPLSGLTGLGGLTNGELQKTSGSNPVLYRARFFLRQSWSPDGGDTQAVDTGFNQLGGQQPRRRLVLTVGNLAVNDLFDNNRYAHDARTQFLNWALLTHGHYDFAADSRGYSRGAALEWFDGGWVLRGGRFEVPRESNGLALDSRIGSRHGDQVEFEHGHSLAGRDGTLRLLAFRNVASMANFDDALAAAGGGVPELAPVRRLQAKVGWGVALEQSLTGDLGGFLRFGRHDGRTEVYSFAAIDDAVSAGLVWRGAAWRRADDQLGVAMVSNGLSASHRRFLAAGGTDFFIGDGALRYGRETIFEAYYSLALTAAVRLSVDAQHIVDPAYNRDRGPANTIALRLHAEL